MNRSLADLVVASVRDSQLAEAVAVSPGRLEKTLGVPRATLNRALRSLVASGQLVRVGSGRAIAYRTPDESHVELSERVTAGDRVNARVSPRWTPAASRLIAALSAPLATRAPVSYQRSFVDRYVPNQSSLLPVALAEALYAEGRRPGQQPAGTYARRVLEQLLIDLSWYSSRLEGNRKSLLDTRELFARGRTEGDDLDAVMLLNHKEAIEFMVDAVPREGITLPVVRNLQSLLMRDLLPDAAELGAIRSTVVHIQDTTYVPSQVPTLLSEMLDRIVERSRSVRNPVEAAFFVWIHLAYLQPFVDGNKRTSRLAANMPLMLANCAPLSFVDVEQGDYALAMLGVYERLDVAIAVELFAWTYRRSIARYKAVIESMGGPDPLRARYREQLTEAICQVVYHGSPAAAAIATLGIPPNDLKAFRDIVDHELQHLDVHNCARYRLPFGKTQEWIAGGRPR